MNLKKDFNITIKPLFHFNNYNEVLEYYKQNKQLKYAIELENIKTKKVAETSFFIGCGNLKLYKNMSNKMVNIYGEYVTEIKYVKENNAIIPTKEEIIECIELDLQAKDQTLADFLEEFGYTDNNVRKGIDVYNSCIKEYNDILEAYKI